MTELDQAKQQLAKGIEEFSRETVLLNEELTTAQREVQVAKAHLGDHLLSRKQVLGDLYARLATAEKADIEQQTKRLLNAE